MAAAAAVGGSGLLAVVAVAPVPFDLNGADVVVADVAADEFSALLRNSDPPLYGCCTLDLLMLLILILLLLVLVDTREGATAVCLGGAEVIAADLPTAAEATAAALPLVPPPGLLLIVPPPPRACLEAVAMAVVALN